MKTSQTRGLFRFHRHLVLTPGKWPRPFHYWPVRTQNSGFVRWTEEGGKTTGEFSEIYPEVLLIMDIPLVNSEINPGMAVGIPRNQLRRRPRSDWIRVMKRMTRDIKKRGKWPFLRTQFPIVPDETPIRSASHTAPRFIPMIKHPSQEETRSWSQE